MTRARISTIRGAGLGFLLSSIMFVFSWSPLALLLVPLGAAVGALVGLTPPRARQETAESESTRASKAWEWIGHHLGHPSVLVRFLSLMVFGTVLFVLAPASCCWGSPSSQGLRGGKRA